MMITAKGEGEESAMVNDREGEENGVERKRGKGMSS